MDRIFGRGTTPGEVASYLVHALVDQANPAQEDGVNRCQRQFGLTVTHRRYVPYSHAHYAGNLVDGAYVLALFGDVATEVCIQADGDEGLFASYSDVQFLPPMRAGDVVEVTATVTRVGTRSRDDRLQSRRGVPGPAGPVGVGGRGAGRAACDHARNRHGRRTGWVTNSCPG